MWVPAGYDSACGICCMAATRCSYMSCTVDVAGTMGAGCTVADASASCADAARSRSGVPAAMNVLRVRRS